MKRLFLFLFLYHYSSLICGCLIFFPTIFDRPSLPRITSRVRSLPPRDSPNSFPIRPFSKSPASPCFAAPSISLFFCRLVRIAFFRARARPVDTRFTTRQPRNEQDVDNDDTLTRSAPRFLLLATELIPDASSVRSRSFSFPLTPKCYVYIILKYYNNSGVARY